MDTGKDPVSFEEKVLTRNCLTVQCLPSASCFAFAKESVLLERDFVRVSVLVLNHERRVWCNLLVSGDKHTDVRTNR